MGSVATMWLQMRKGVVSMISDSVVRARINGKVKDEASDILGAMGLTLSDAYRMLLIRVVEDRALPFDLLNPNEETIAAMREARTKRLPSYDSAEALFSELNAED